MFFFLNIYIYRLTKSFLVNISKFESNKDKFKNKYILECISGYLIQESNWKINKPQKDIYSTISKNSINIDTPEENKHELHFRIV